MKLQKDAAERVVLEQFKAAFPFFPSGVVRKGVAGREPDFLIDTGPEVLGIELAALYRDDGDDHLGVLRQAIAQRTLVELAKKKFQTSTAERRRVYISFAERSGITNRNQNTLAQFLADVVLQAISGRAAPGQRGIQIGIGRLHPYDFCFKLVQIYDRDRSIDNSWSISNAFEVESLNESIVQNRIHEKEVNLASGLYSGANRVWLLLHSDFKEHASDQQLPEKLREPIKQSGFERIIIFKTIENKCLTIFPGQP